MAEQLDDREVIEFDELVFMNTVQIDTMFQLLVEKGLFTEAEFLDKMKQVQTEYQIKKPATE